MNGDLNEGRSVRVVCIMFKVIVHCILRFVDLGYKNIETTRNEESKG